MCNRRELIRLLHGELDETAAADLKKRLRSEETLRKEWKHLQRLWKKLDIPRTPEAPQGFSKRVTAIAMAEEQTLNFKYAPFWARTTALASLAAGLTVGVLLVDPPKLPQVEAVVVEKESGWLEAEDLASQYLSVLDSPVDEVKLEN